MFKKKPANKNQRATVFLSFFENLWFNFGKHASIIYLYYIKCINAGDKKY